ncbi:MAG TPA: IS110 family transposase [Acidobacteriaceae bacterium]|nr:IS110 family transposase [Acidobacteriaceae bacterium]
MKNTSNQTSRKAAQNRGAQDSICTTATQRAAGKHHQLIKLGVDTHAEKYVFARMVDSQGCQPPQSMTPENFLKFLQKQNDLAERVVVVYEAGPYGYALYRQVMEMGVECLVCAPERMSRGRKRVNDKIDAKELLSRLDRLLAGNTTALRLVRPPTLEQEMARRLARERNTYKKDKKRYISRGRSCLHTLGISRPGKWWEMERYQQLLKQIGQRYGDQVKQQVTAELDRYLELIQDLQAKLDELTAQLQTAAAKKKQPRIKGIGHFSSELLDREIGDWSRFKNRRQIASYTGLCPGEESSGDRQMNLSIDKHGNPRVRAVLVELAWLLPRFQPRYKPLERWGWIFDKQSKASKPLRKKATVALARRLAVDLWRIRTNRAKPEDLGLVLFGAGSGDGGLPG